MPDHRKLRIGDRIRILRVPDCDRIQREREMRDQVDDAGWTANTIERIIAFAPVQMISAIDEYGHPWFECRIPGPTDALEEHSLTILDDDSWEYI